MSSSLTLSSLFSRRSLLVRHLSEFVPVQLLMRSIPPRFPSRCYCCSLLHSARGRDFCRKFDVLDDDINLTLQQWVVISLNLTVHVIMCKSMSSYNRHRLMTRLLLLRYCRWCPNLGTSSAFENKRILTLQWKKYLTTLQITQFVIDLFIVFFASKSSAMYPAT